MCITDTFFLACGGILGHSDVLIGPPALIKKKNLYASKPSEHPPVRGKTVKTFRWDHRLQIQNLLMAI